MFDTDEKIRKFINLQKEKLNRIAMVGSLILLAFNSSMLLFSYVKHRGIHPYIGIPLIFFTVILIIWLVAHLYVMKMEMYRTEASQRRLLDPYTIYALCPYEEMWFRHVFIPLMESNYNLLPEGELKDRVKQSLDKVKVWVVDGIIPKSHFPKHLKKYYLTDKEIRL